MAYCENCYHKVCCKNYTVKSMSACNDYKSSSQVLELLCNVGDRVYIPTTEDVIEMLVVRIKITNNEIYCECVNPTYTEYEDFFYMHDVGKKVFLTLKEAEKYNELQVYSK